MSLLLSYINTTGKRVTTALLGVGCAAALYGVFFTQFGRVLRSNAPVDSEKHAGTLVGRALKAHGVTRLFALPGGHVSPMIAGAEAEGIQIVDVRHEADAVFAADATSRLTGTIGVAIVTAGPGVTNTLTAVKNAQMAQSPVLVLGGASATIAKGRGSLQDIDQLSLFSSCTKGAFTCERICDIVGVIRRAIQLAMSGAPGPVFVEVPVDLLYPVFEVAALLGLRGRSYRGQALAALKKDVNDAERQRLFEQIVIPLEHRVDGQDRHTNLVNYLKTLPSDASPVCVRHNSAKMNPLIEWFFNHELKRLYGDAWQAYDYSPLPLQIPQISSSQLAAIRKLVAEAKHPAVIVGSQIMCGLTSDDGRNHVASALREFGAPVFLSGMARGMMGRDHPRFLRQNRKLVLKEADVVFLFGVSVDFRLDYGRVFTKHTKVVHINLCTEELSRNTDVMWKPYMKVHAAPAKVLLRLVGSAEQQQQSSPSSSSSSRLLLFKSCDGEWIKKWKDAEKTKEQRNAASGGNAPGRGEKAGVELLHPLDLCTGLEKQISAFCAQDANKNDKVIYVGDGGDFVGTAANVVRPDGPGTWLDPGAFGTLGCGAGFALAAKLAFPDAVVIILWGDGSAGYSIAEYDTFRRHKAPVISVVGNDACWTQIVREQVPYLNTDAACNLAYCEYEKIALSYAATAAGSTASGASSSSSSAPIQAICLDKLDLVEPTFAEVLKTYKEKRIGACVNALIGNSTFRQGSISL